jgi:hypothetical protein
MSERSGATVCSPWFYPVCRAKASEGAVGWPVRQRNLSADLIYSPLIFVLSALMSSLRFSFWLLLYQDKSNSHRGN